MNKKINFKHSDDSLRKTFKSIHGYDLAIVFESIDKDERLRFINLIDNTQLSEMFVSMEHEEQTELFNLLEIPKQKILLRNLESDDLKAFIEEFDEESEREAIISLLSAIKRKAIHLLLTYNENLAASIMSTDFLTISRDMTIKEATNYIVTNSREQDYIDTIFVENDEKEIVGLIDLRQLIMTRSGKKIFEVMVEDIQYIYEYETIEKAIESVQDYDRNCLPVLNSKKRIIGIITADDVFDEIVESSEEDYQKMALIADHDSSSSAFERSKKRLPWLLIAVILNLVIATILSMFQVTLIEVVALVLFQPTILGMAGNIGTQALAVTILGLHLDEIDDKKKARRHAFKEMTVGFINSLLLATAAFAFVSIFLSIVPTGNQVPFTVAFVVFISVFASMFIAGTMGALVPLIFNHFHIDPSAASGPIMTTINDLVTLIIYFGIATIIFI
ncbi:MAG: magnesium transporter [Acholeplasmataceae bacterium]|nr:magnesium transporter [Acholeplasmataceae bacterium]